ncbi:TolC family outer membrane protein [Xenophilus sp. Marseille-Q4582]|uniref:TolC family outer membrane protein n=1 Tax=Xenophilus sp. Marseille-Q4582 TaxID=2866600 RepID=UPI001CE45357|nr:TolC family outer membrane protein [Xenophilus sp. Marseille-Q4582]
MSRSLTPALCRAGGVALACTLLWAGGALAQQMPAPAPTPAAPGTLSPVLVSDASDASAGIDLVQAVRAAAQTHPAVRGAARQILQADEGIAAARAGYYPQVRAGVGSQLSNRTISPYDSRRVHTASVSVSQMLYDFGKVASAVQEAEASVAATQAQALLSVDDVARETALAWLEVYRQQAMGEIARDQVRGVQALADLVMERERKGASSRSDVEQARSRVEAARAQVLDTAAQVRRWRISLMHLTGARSVGTIAGTPPAVLETACGAGAGADGAAPPAVRLAQAQREQAEAALRAADAQLLPTLSLDGSVSRGLDARSRLPGDNGLSTSVGLNFSAPLYEGGGNQARQRAAVHALGAADAALARARLVAAQELEDARAQAQGHAQRLPVLEARVASIRATRDLYRQQYLQLGTRSLLDLLNAEQEYHTVRFDHAASVHEQYRLGLLCLYHTDRLRTAFGLDALPAVADGGLRPGGAR